MAFSSAGANAFFDKRDARREKRRDREELRKEKELDRAFQRENSLFALSLENLKNSNEYLTGDKYTSAVKANKTLRQGLMDEDLTAEDLEFYKPILEDPFAAQFVQDFIEDRAGQGLNITYSMIPSMLNVMSSNAPEPEKIDFIERITGTDFTGEAGIKRYRELATEIVSAPSEIQSTLFISPKPGMDLNIKNKDLYQKAQREKIEAQLIPLAKMKLRRDAEQYGIEDQRVQNLQKLLNELERGGEGANRAFNQLMPMVLDKASFDLLIKTFQQDFIGYEENPYLPNITALFPDLEEE
tara:strand:- start:2158 stop:3051 length:894 start_codon:yes stop_codon:yes gene_type:complete